MAEKPTEVLEQILASPDCEASKIRDCDEVLTQIFRRLLVLRRPKRKTWRQMLVSYVKRMIAAGQQMKSPSSERGNLSKAFTSPYITIRTFNRGMQFLEMSSYKLILEARDKDGKPIRVESDTIQFSIPTPVSEHEIEEVDADLDSAPKFGKVPRPGDLVVKDED